MEPITPQLNNVTKRIRKAPKVSESTKAKHKKVLDEMASNGGNLPKALEAVGYSKTVVKTPSKVTDTRSFQELMDERLSDDEATRIHKGLLNSSRLDHMTFGLGPKDEKEKAEYIAQRMAKAEKEGKEYEPIDYITDQDIREMLADVGCTVRRIAHREMSRDVYFWSPDNLARDKALDKVYKLKRRYGVEEGVKPPTGNIYNFIFSADTQARIKNMEAEIKKALIQKPIDVQEIA